MYFWCSFAQLEQLPHYPIRGSSPSNLCWMGCRRYSAASRLEVLLDEDEFRSFLQALELGDVLLLLQLSVAWYSKINFVFVFLIHRDGLHRTCLIIFNMFGCQNATFCGFVSGYGFLRTRGICDLIMFLLIECVAIKIGTFQRFFSPSSNRLPALDNWVSGCSSIRWMSLLLLPISESKSNVQLSL